MIVLKYLIDMIARELGSRNDVNFYAIVFELNGERFSSSHLYFLVGYP